MHFQPLVCFISVVKQKARGLGGKECVSNSQNSSWPLSHPWTIFVWSCEICLRSSLRMIVCPVFFLCCTGHSAKIASIVQHNEPYSVVCHSTCNLPELSIYRRNERNMVAFFVQLPSFSKPRGTTGNFVLHSAPAPHIMVGNHTLSKTPPSVQRCVTSPELNRSCPKKWSRSEKVITCMTGEESPTKGDLITTYSQDKSGQHRNVLRTK